MTDQKPTRNQRDAIGLINQDLPVTAGAGSGKTFVLTHRYFQILAEQQADLSEILTITFTEKAANQMTRKIRDLIRRFAHDDIPQEFPPLKKRGFSLPDRQYWRGLLDKFDQSYISTIHGFCARVLRESGIWTGIDPEFSIMDEHITGVRQPQIVRNTIFQLIYARDKSVSHLLHYFSVSQLTRKIAEILRKRLQYSGLVNFYFDQEDNPRTVDILVEQNKSLFSEVATPLIEQFAEHPLWQQIRKDVLAMEPASPEAQTDHFYPHWEHIRESVHQLNATEDPITLANVWIGLKKNLKSKGKKSNWTNVDLGSLKSNMKEFRDCVLEPALGKIPPFDLDVEQEAIRLAQSVVKIYQHVLENYEEWKNQHNYLDYDDLLTRTVETFENHPDILKSYQKQFRYILIDEFQDTSPIQYRLANLLHDDGKTSSMFIVGDPKQSIYRFRGTEVSLFHQAERNLGYQETVLDLSFRSQPALLEWIDQSFTKIMGIESEDSPPLKPYEQYYLPLKANRDNITSPASAVSIQLIECDKTAENSSLENKLHIEAAHITKWLKEELHEILVEDENEVRPASFGDVAMLFRRSTYIKQYEFALQMAGIPYYTVSGSGFFEKQEIIDLLNVLRALASPEDAISLVGTLRSNIFGMSDEGLYWLAKTNIPWYDLVFNRINDVPENLTDTDREVFHLVRERMGQWRRMIDRYSPDRMIEDICMETGYPGILASSREGSRKVRNVEQFIELAHNFAKFPQTTLRTFLDYIASIREYSDTEEAPLHFGEQDAVQLMTIHKAKGLEFPVVIIPNIDYAGHNQIQHDFYREYGLAWQWTDPRKPAGKQRIKPFIYRYIYEKESKRDIAESKRLFYVACTRARDHLLVSGVFDGPGGLAKLEEKVDYQKDNWLQWVVGVLTGLGWEFGKETVLMKEDYVNVLHHAYLDVPQLPGIGEIIPQRQTITDETESTSSILPVEEIRRRWKIPSQASVPDEIHPSMLPVFHRDKEEFYNTFIRKIPGEYHQSGAEDDYSGPAFGSLVHQILETFITKPEVNLEQLIEKEISGSDFAGEGVEKRAILTGMEQFKNSPLYQKCQELRCFTEVEFVTTLEGFILSGQIDLLMERDPGTYILVDYKTDLVVDGQFKAKVEEYWLQLAAYAYGIQKSTGVFPTEIILYFWQYGREVFVPIGPKQVEELKETVREIRRFLSERGI